MAWEMIEDLVICSYCKPYHNYRSRFKKKANKVMYLKSIIIGLVYISSVMLHSLAYANDKVGTLSSISDVALPNGLVAYIDPVEGAIYEVNMNGVVTWKYKIPSKIKNRGSLRHGADIEWLKDNDHFLFVVPKAGIYEVNRQKEIVWFYETRLVSHDADRLPNGNTIFVNAWDRPGDKQVVEITPEGKMVFEWKIADIGLACSDKTADCTHINAVQKFADGSFLVSLRDLNEVVLIDKNLEVIERYQGIRLVHDPLFMDDQIIAVARRLGLVSRGHKHLSSKKESTILLRYVENGYRFLRTNELISDDNILLTGTRHLLIFNLNLKKIIWKIKLDGFGDQKSNKKLPFLYKAAWVSKK